MDNVTTKLVNIFIETAQSIGLCKENREKKYFKGKAYCRRHPHFEWFDDECERERKEYLEIKNNGRTICGREARMKHSQLLSRKHYEYKKLIAKKQTKFSNDIAKRLRECRISDPKGFWKILNGGSKQRK